jgi:hypothetical protein
VKESAAIYGLSRLFPEKSAIDTSGNAQEAAHKLQKTNDLNTGNQTGSGSKLVGF